MSDEPDAEICFLLEAPDGGRIRIYHQDERRARASASLATQRISLRSGGRRPGVAIGDWRLVMSGEEAEYYEGCC